jgi:hypothetical protein
MRVVRGLNRARWGIAVDSKLIVKPSACNQTDRGATDLDGIADFCHFRLLASRSRGRYAQ